MHWYCAQTPTLMRLSLSLPPCIPPRVAEEPGPQAPRAASITGAGLSGQPERPAGAQHGRQGAGVRHSNMLHLFATNHTSHFTSHFTLHTSKCKKM